MNKPTRRILFTTDLSEASWSALPWAAEAAAHHGASLEVLSVVEHAFAPGTIGQDDHLVQVLRRVEPEVHERIEQEIARHAKELEGIPVNIRVCTGASAHQEILHYLEEHPVHMVVMATHGWTGWSRLFLGSTTERVLRASAVPVLVIRHGRVNGH